RRAGTDGQCACGAARSTTRSSPSARSTSWPEMPTSHPPTLLTIAARALGGEGGLFGRGDRVLVAVSGGPDSMALLHVLASLRTRIGHAVVAHGVDHGLRPAAAAELDTVA